MESKVIKSIRSTSQLRKIVIIHKVNNNRKENKPKEVITYKIIKKFMDPYLVLLTIKIKQLSGQQLVNHPNQNYQKQKS